MQLEAASIPGSLTFGLNRSNYRRISRRTAIMGKLPMPHMPRTTSFSRLAGVFRGVGSGIR
jgi:hypothetical protein